MLWAALFQFLLIAANYLKPFVRLHQKGSFRLNYAQNYKTLGLEVFFMNRDWEGKPWSDALSRSDTEGTEIP